MPKALRLTRSTGYRKDSLLGGTPQWISTSTRSSLPSKILFLAPGWTHRYAVASAFPSSQNLNAGVSHQGFEDDKPYVVKADVWIRFFQVLLVACHCLILFQLLVSGPLHGLCLLLVLTSSHARKYSLF